MECELASTLIRLACSSAVSLSCWTAMAQEPTLAEPEPPEAEVFIADQPSATPAPLQPNQPGPTNAAVKVEVITERYPNRAVKIERHVTQDAEGNYINHGMWSYWDEKGALIGSGEYRHGQRHGKWTRWFDAGKAPVFTGPMFKQFQAPFVSEATFENGKLQGTWAIFDSQDRQVSAWQFVDGNLHGKSVWWYPNGLKYREIEYRNGQIDGLSLEWNLEAGQPVRSGNRTIPGQPVHKLVSKYVYEDGRRYGQQVEWFAPNVKKAEGGYLYAKEVTESSLDWWNGTLKTVVVQKQGVNQKQGLWTWYHKNGGKQLEGEYDADRPVGVHTWWHSNGQKQIEGTYEDGKQSGKWVWWHANGQKQVEGEYIAGQQTGIWTKWADDGKVTEVQDFTVATYKDELLDPNKAPSVAEQLAPKRNQPSIRNRTQPLRRR